MVVTPLVQHVFDTSPVEGPAYAIHLTLAVLADEDSHVRVSQPELARMSRVSMSTMRRCVRELIDADLVVVVEPPNQRIPALLRVEGAPRRGTGETPLRRRQGVRSDTSKRRQGVRSDTSSADALLALELSDQPTTDVVGSAATAEPRITGRGIAGRVWKLKNPKPAQPFMAVVKIAEALLEAGNDPCKVEQAMLVVPTISTRTVEFEMNKARPNPIARRTELMQGEADRAKPSGVIKL